ncbi:MAG TPA: helix-turn-helix domain-containing protein [Solirubrobacteraceae bacterium]|nr:helix-turn-helix domain-containing protein [Solirubrobacteraceae bacterium]
MSTVIEDLMRLEERILARIAELEENVAELEQLRDVARRLGILDEGSRDDVAPTTSAPIPSTTARRRPAASRSRASGTRARTGGARSTTLAVAGVSTARQSTRRERVLEVVGGEPGISVREIVAQLGVNRTSLYPVVRQLVSDGLLHKDGPGLWPAVR